MRYDPTTVAEAQRRALNTITTPFRKVIKFDSSGNEDAQIVPNKFWVEPYKVTSPVEIIQEQQVTATKQSYTFSFTWNAPPPTAQLNNVVLPKNNVAAIYGLRLLWGLGDTAVNRVYRSSGLTAADNSIYNSTISMKIETDDAINYLDGSSFLDIYDSPNVIDATSGLCLLNPQRILTGEMGIFSVTVQLKNPNSALVYTPSSWLSMRLVTVMGQASAQAKN